METKYHIEITHKALEAHFSDRALTQIINANIRQDRMTYMLGHDHIHFDGSAFEEGYRYISTQEDLVYKHIDLSDFKSAREAFGRIIHSWQDFYSHSNYVELWLREHPDDTPESIIMDDQNILNNPQLMSGKNYGLIEFFAMIPGLSKLVEPLMPADSHAKMNLDSPSSGTYFAYAYWAAKKRTYMVYEDIIQFINNRNYDHMIVNQFKDK